jgi:polyhydroxyalkanoate synthesis regulator phasin
MKLKAVVLFLAVAVLVTIARAEVSGRRRLALTDQAPVQSIDIRDLADEDGRGRKFRGTGTVDLDDGRSLRCEVRVKFNRKKGRFAYRLRTAKGAWPKFKARLKTRGDPEETLRFSFRLKEQGKAAVKSLLQGDAARAQEVENVSEGDERSEAEAVAARIRAAVAAGDLTAEEGRAAWERYLASLKDDDDEEGDDEPTLRERAAEFKAVLGRLVDAGKLTEREARAVWEAFLEALLAAQEKEETIRGKAAEYAAKLRRLVAAGELTEREAKAKWEAFLAELRGGEGGKKDRDCGCDGRKGWGDKKDGDEDDEDDEDDD